MLSDWREPAERVGCSGMHRIVLLAALLTRAVAVHVHITGACRKAAERVGCSGMHRIVLLAALLTRAVAVHVHITGIHSPVVLLFWSGACRKPAERVGCSGMHRIVLLAALLTRVVAHSLTSPGTEPTYPAQSTMPPTVFHNPPNTKPRRVTNRKGKADSPMLNYIFDSYATSNKHFHDTFKAPSFDGDMSSDTLINADTGATVLFDCRVTSLRDKTVSWIRVSDEDNLELLTVDLETHTADYRYKVDVAGETWKLTLSDAKVHDSGIYCCHVSTHPPMLKRFKLIVHAPEIKMNKEAFLESGETLSLKCAVLHLSAGETSPEIRWYRGNSTASLDEIRGGVLIETDLLTLTSHLQVALLKVEDAGNYTCALEAPLLMKTFARVHVLQGSSLAELQSGVKTTTSYVSLLLTTLIFLVATQNGVR
ncbi:uncharacterized protein LOC112049423 [Bicyclus anynana]|uniref:Uncharacterized protein LOC112049423 n=1 Tax=Bicyclus anynana TaxID=110368 RepID=A0ABM3LYV8_BICAN|nr:uncharacterized protein LOC112049423 [Bicyclus anynana]